MSRIGKQSIQIPPNVEVIIHGTNVKVTGPRGTLDKSIPDLISISQKDNALTLQKRVDSLKAQKLYGTSRSLINNLVIGVAEEFKKHLEIHGVGYRAQIEGKNLLLNLGYSHSVTISPPEGISIRVEKNTYITVLGINKELVGQVAANIRSLRSPEPYKGKGIRYQGEMIKRKVGKAGRGK